MLEGALISIRCTGRIGAGAGFSLPVQLGVPNPAGSHFFFFFVNKALFSLSGDSMHFGAFDLAAMQASGDRSQGFGCTPQEKLCAGFVQCRCYYLCLPAVYLQKHSKLHKNSDDQLKFSETLHCRALGTRPPHVGR